MDTIPQVVLNLTPEAITLVDVRSFYDAPIVLQPGVSLDLSAFALDVDLAVSFHLKHLADIGAISVLSTFQISQLQAGEQGIDNVEIIGTPTVGQIPTATSPITATWQTPAFRPSGTAGGDLSGSYPNPMVAAIDGITLSGTPSTGQVLTATSSSAADWQTHPSSTPGGSSSEIQYNSSGSFAGATITTDGNSLTIPNGNLVVQGPTNYGVINVVSSVAGGEASIGFRSEDAGQGSPGDWVIGASVDGSVGNFNLWNQGSDILTVTPSAQFQFSGTTSLDSGSITTDGSGNITAVSVTASLNGNASTASANVSMSTDPISPSAGQVWFNTTDNQFKGYNGSSIVILG